MAALLVSLVALSGMANDPANAADPATMLRDAQARLEAAASPAARLAALGAAVAAHEASLQSLRATLRAMPARREALAARLGPLDGARLAAIAALHRATAAPAAARMLHPGGPLVAARAALLLGGATETVTRVQAALAETLDALVALERERVDARHALAASLADLETARATLAAALADRARPQAREADRLLARALAEETATLDDLAILIDRLAPEGAEIAVQRAAFDAAVGRLPLPATGRVGTDGDTLVLDLPAYAVARAPWLSTVRHAGPVGLLGSVLVLEPAPGVLISFRGLASVDRVVAEVVHADEPLGHMGGGVPAGEEFLIDERRFEAGTATRRLYIDTWRDGQAEPAASWFVME